MKSNQEILNKIGSELTKKVYDDAIHYFKQLVEGTSKWNMGQEYTQVFDKLNSEDKSKIEKYLKETIETTMFAFLGFFEQQEEFKLIYQEEDEQVNLVEISEMLKAEPTIEGGWIDRFSQYSKDN